MKNYIDIATIIAVFYLVFWLVYQHPPFPIWIAFIVIIAIWFAEIVFLTIISMITEKIKEKGEVKE